MSRGDMIGSQPATIATRRLQSTTRDHQHRIHTRLVPLVINRIRNCPPRRIGNTLGLLEHQPSDRISFFFRLPETQSRRVIFGVIIKRGHYPRRGRRPSLS